MWQLKKKKSKTEILKYMKVISKFCPAGHLILIFIRRIPPPPPPPKKKKKKKKKKRKSFPSGKSFPQMLFHSLSEVSIGFGGKVFS